MQSCGFLHDPGLISVTPGLLTFEQFRLAGSHRPKASALGEIETGFGWIKAGQADKMRLRLDLRLALKILLQSAEGRLDLLGISLYYYHIIIILVNISKKYNINK